MKRLGTACLSVAFLVSLRLPAWAADVAAYESIHTQILHMADMLSAGIIGQFPQKFE